MKRNLKQPYKSKGRPRPPFSQEWKDNISKSRLGHIVPLNVREKISAGHKGKKKTVAWKTAMSFRVKGSNNPMWRGGVSSLHQQIRNNPKYRQWRSDVFSRDNFTCQICFDRGGYIEADHIKPLTIIMKENLVISLDDAINCEELWNVNNGRTLCKDCHKGTPTYGIKVKKYV